MVAKLFLSYKVTLWYVMLFPWFWVTWFYSSLYSLRLLHHTVCVHSTFQITILHHKQGHTTAFNVILCTNKNYWTWNYIYEFDSWSYYSFLEIKSILSIQITIRICVLYCICKITEGNLNFTSFNQWIRHLKSSDNYKFVVIVSTRVLSWHNCVFTYINMNWNYYFVQCLLTFQTRPGFVI